MKLTDRLIADWRGSWRFLSVQFGIAAGLLSSAIISAAPGLVIEVLRAPLLERAIVAVMVGAAVVLLPWLARILKQGGGDDCPK
jgi:hypothetical protein